MSKAYAGKGANRAPFPRCKAAQTLLKDSKSLAIKGIMTFASHSSIQMSVEHYSHLFPSPDYQKVMVLVEQHMLG